VLDAAGDRRVPGRPVPPVAPADALTSFRRRAGAVREVLAAVPRSGWACPTEPYPWTVHGLVGHLVGAERYLGGVLGLWPFTPIGPEHDHIGVTEPFVAAAAGTDPAATIREWLDLVTAVGGHIEQLPAEHRRRPIGFHGLALHIDTVLVIRAFELWTHADDIRRALGWPLTTPSAGELAAMADLSVRSLTPALPRRAPHRSSRSARIVLTGPGGGVWRLGAPAPAPDVNVIADVVDWCRMAARRLDAAELRADITGDRELAGDLFRAARLLAA
jgi:uncharacterized protein (TIGR03083 family)